MPPVFQRQGTEQAITERHQKISYLTSNDADNDIDDLNGTCSTSILGGKDGENLKKLRGICNKRLDG